MHLKFRQVLILAMVFFTVSPVFPQKNFKTFGNMSLGFKISTLGYGFEAATPLSNSFILRLGVNLTNGLPIGKMIGEHNIILPDGDGKFLDSFGYLPELMLKGDVNLTHGNLLLDFHPAGLFHFTVGAFAGKSIFKVEGHLVDSENDNQLSVLLPGKKWPFIEAGNQKIVFPDGCVSMDLQLGNNTFKPYFGLGFGRAVPKNSRLSFMLEVGVLYQKHYTLRQRGIVFDLTAIDEPEVIKVHNTLVKYGAFWPMLNLQLSYRIF